MSESKIPASNGQYKHLHILDENLTIAEVYGPMRVGEPWPLPPRPAKPPQPTATAPQPPAKPRRRREPVADAKSYTPIEHTLYSVQTFGWTHPSTGHFLMVPTKEYQALQALETKAVAAGVWELMQQTIGWEGIGPGGRREWAPLSVRHFDRAGILSRKQAERGINRALAKGYIERRRLGARGYEYRLRWKGTN